MSAPLFAHKMGWAVLHPLWLLAWVEYQAAQGRSHMRDGVHDQGRGNVPRWFVVCELGEGACGCARCFGDSGSISKAFARWRKVNREILDELAGGAPGASALGGADRESPLGAPPADTIAALRERHGE